MKLSDHQETALDKIMGWMKTKEKRFVLGGYAGTGKTTVAREISDRLNEVLFAAYTGKAANVLREKGIAYAETLHSMIYLPSEKATEEEKKLKSEYNELVALKKDKEATELLKKIKDLKKKPSFRLNQDSIVKQAKLVILDEYSMLNDFIIRDLESLAPKVLYLGDPFQLPPVQGQCSLEMDHVLTEVHRQALDSPILRFATDVREGRGWRKGYMSDECEVTDKNSIESFNEADQVIVGKNATRIATCSWMRKRIGFNESLPMRGDKLICRSNNRELGVFNGMIGEALSSAPVSNDAESYKLSFKDIGDIDAFLPSIEWRGDSYNYKIHRDLVKFEYAYAVTAHLSQGSEWDNVLVKHEPIGQDEESRRKWLYTSATRAKKRLKVVV